MNKLHAREHSRNQSILRFDVILQHDWPVEQCLLHIRVFFGAKTKSPCSDLFIHWLIKQITKTYRNHFSRSYENRYILLHCSQSAIFRKIVEIEPFALRGETLDECQICYGDVGRFVFSRLPPPTATNFDVRPLGTYETQVAALTRKRSILTVLRKNCGTVNSLYICMHQYYFINEGW